VLERETKTLEVSGLIPFLPTTHVPEKGSSQETDLIGSNSLACNQWAGSLILEHRGLKYSEVKV
jgi:hypothetical protein